MESDLLVVNQDTLGSRHIDVPDSTIVAPGWIWKQGIQEEE
jgi:hypothetical protein